MSLIITVRTSEGIVLASDSRTTYTRTENNNGTQTIKFGVHFSDTTYKTFLCDNRIGISTCGSGNINGKSIASHIENYINNEYDKNDSIETTAQKLLNYFSCIPHSNSVIFHIAGYEKENSIDVVKVYRIETIKKKIELDETYGARWDGETEVLTRLIKNGYIVSQDKVIIPRETQISNHILIPSNSLRHPEMDIAWELMTLQDGIDFAEYAIRTTIDTMRFQVAPKTVGAPIDILVIRPHGAQWIKHKELHA